MHHTPTRHVTGTMTHLHPNASQIMSPSLAALLLLALAVSPASACPFARMAGSSASPHQQHQRQLLANTTKSTSTAGSLGADLVGADISALETPEWVIASATGFDRVQDVTNSAINAGNMFVSEGAKLKAMLEWTQAQRNSGVDPGAAQQDAVEWTQTQRNKTDMCHWGIISMPTPNFNAVDFTDEDAVDVYAAMVDALKRAQGLVKRYKNSFLLAAAST
jgi:hypothetical protein